MPRVKKNVEVRRQMCSRFVALVNELGMTSAEVSRALGYANATTIAKVQRGEVFLDVERLSLLGNLLKPNGSRVDLNWLLTGRGVRQ